MAAASSKNQEEPVLYRKPLPPSNNFLNKSTPNNNNSKIKKVTRKAPPTFPHSLISDTQSCDFNEIHIYPLHPKGPRPLPMGKIFRQLPTQPHTEYNSQPFTLNDFMLTTDEQNQCMKQRKLIQSQCGMISRDNYLKMTSWFTKHVPVQSTLHVQLLTIDQVASKTRKPLHQVLLEFQSMFNQLLSQVTTQEEEERGERTLLDNSEDLLVQGPQSSYFCGEKRSSSPFDSSSSDSIGVSEMAVLYSMLHGGRYLSLKAHFITHIPNLLPLTQTLTHLNLSFNCIQVFPSEICELFQLRELYFRNNPIKEIPSAIQNLQYLKLLSIPFNLLTDLPSGLFELSSLEHLDVSHNTIQWISRDISKLMNLTALFVQCNQLTGLPCTALCLPIGHLKVDSNYFHQMLWKENTHNTPQLLSDLCCVVLDRIKHTLPTTVQSSINKPTGICDWCNGPIYGCGLRVIRSIKEYVFNIRHLPFIFTVCSSTCHRSLSTNNLQYKYKMI